MSEHDDNSPESHAAEARAARRGKSDQAFRTISEVATELDVQQHVLRFWETRFNQIKPLKRGGGRRYYRPEDVALLKGIRKLLHDDGYTIKGVQKVLRESGVKAVSAMAGNDADNLSGSESETVTKYPADLVPVAQEQASAETSSPAPIRETSPLQAETDPAPVASPAMKGLDDKSREKLGNLLSDLKAMRDSLKSSA
jgi:DNA-binding transcriptional MerR regulator